MNGGGGRPPLQVILGVMLPSSSISSGLVCSDAVTVSMGFSQPSEDSSNLYAPMLPPESRNRAGRTEGRGEEKSPPTVNSFWYKSSLFEYLAAFR